MKKLIPFILITSLFLAACDPAEETTQEAPMIDYLATETADQRTERMSWWKEAKFGMFIHWGLYAVPAGEYNGERTSNIGEWIMHHLQIPIAEYETFAPQFNPVKYDAQEWVRIAKNAGMKYIVITSKHHDGFGLWHSDVSDWDVDDASPYEKDILKELAIACEEADIQLCFYHSIMDWHHPDAQAMWEPEYNQWRTEGKSNPNFPRYYEEYMKPQLEELITGYGPLGVLWFDGEWVPDFTEEMGKDLYNYVRNLQPDIIINNRVDKGRQGMQGMNREGNFAGDFGTPEQEIPATGIEGVDWESCMTMNDTWGFKHFDENWKSDTTLIQNLIDIVSKGGNFLLNVGPTAEGLIPEASVERLAAMGEWMAVNQEAIYGAKASPYERPDWGRYTSKEGMLYAHIFEWPDNQKLMIPELTEATSAHMLGSDTPLSIATSEAGTIVSLPTDAPDGIATVIAIQK